jgi:hypothetical protein
VERRQRKDAEVKDAFRVWRDRCRIILEEAGTWASCVPDLIVFFYIFLFILFNFIILFLLFILFFYLN